MCGSLTDSDCKEDGMRQRDEGRHRVSGREGGFLMCGCADWWIGGFVDGFIFFDEAI